MYIHERKPFKKICNHHFKIYMIFTFTPKIARPTLMFLIWIHLGSLMGSCNGLANPSTYAGMLEVSTLRTLTLYHSVDPAKFWWPNFILSNLPNHLEGALFLLPMQLEPDTTHGRSRQFGLQRLVFATPSPGDYHCKVWDDVPIIERERERGNYCIRAYLSSIQHNKPWNSMHSWGHIF